MDYVIWKETFKKWVGMNDVNTEIKSEVEVSFFVPCFNESGNIIPTIENIVSVANDIDISYEIIVYDDASTDSSVEEVQKIMSSNPRYPIRLLRNKENRGLARNYCDGSYVAVGKMYMLINGDNVEPAESIKKILKFRGTKDIIIPIYEENDNRSRGRTFLSKFFTNLVNFFSGNKIGYYNGPALHLRKNIMRWHADTDGFAYQAEIITRLLQEGATYKEVVISNTDRMLGSSSALNIKNFLSVSHSLLQIILRRVRVILFY